MNIYECGSESGEVIVLIHPSAVTWEYFERVIPLLKEEYHLLIPALPGYDMSNHSEFTSVEKIASGLADHLLTRGITDIRAIYGCSMGGSIALRMAADGKVKAQHYIMDGGITPYQLPRIITGFIAVRDFAMMAMGKLGGEKLLVRAFSSTEYTEEDLKYVADVFSHCTYRTLWNTFDSCNNYRMPDEVMHFPGTVHYWYGEKEKKARDWDIRYMRKYVPDTVFREFPGTDHADLPYMYPEVMAEALKEL